MPSKALNVATDSQPAPVGSGSGRNSVTDEPTTLPQQVLAIIQHKWRNLEKRKKKLDEYKKIGEANLKADQKEALSHFGEVVQLLDLLGDMKKQFETTFTDYEIAQKKQAKAEKNAQRKRDVERMRDVLEIRLVLNSLSDATTRSELRRNNKVTDAELSLIDKFLETVEPTPSSACGKTEAFLSSATECFERVLRREEKPFHEKQSYAQLKVLFSRLYQVISESSAKVQHSSNSREEVQANSSEKSEDQVETNHRPGQHHNQKSSDDSNNNNVEHSVRQGSPKKHQHADQHHQAAAKEPVQQAAAKLEEIVKPGSFSFLQESQISSSGNQQHRVGGHPREFVNSNADHQIGSWAPGRAENEVDNSQEDKSGGNAGAYSNRGTHANDGSNHAHGDHHSGGRNRGDRGNRQHGQQRHRRPAPQSGGADENNEAAAGWPQDDADYTEWKPVEAGSGSHRGDAGGWIGGNQDNRRRGGPSGNRGGNGGRGNFHRGQQNSGQQFGDNRRHFNRGPRPGAPSNQQPRSATVGGSAE